MKTGIWHIKNLSFVKKDFFNHWNNAAAFRNLEQNHDIAVILN
jgi:hypothetical protein